MTASKSILGCVFLLGPLACQPTGERSSDAAERLEQRLSAIEAKLDTIDTRLDQSQVALAPLMSWMEASKNRDEAREARRVENEAKREAREAQRGAREDLVSPFATESSSRAIEGADEAIECTGFETPKVECSVERALLERILSDPSLLTKQARIVPSQRDGTTIGFKLYGIRRVSLPRLFGINNGDLMTGVNGDPLNSLDKAMELFSKLRKAKSVTFEIERKGSPYSLKVDITG